LKLNKEDIFRDGEMNNELEYFDLLGIFVILIINDGIVKLKAFYYVFPNNIFFLIIFALK